MLYNGVDFRLAPIVRRTFIVVHFDCHKKVVYKILPNFKSEGAALTETLCDIRVKNVTQDYFNLFDALWRRYFDI